MPELVGGAEAVETFGYDLLLLLVVLLVVDVVVLSLPDWYVVDELELYPPEISVLSPLTLLLSSANVGVIVQDATSVANKNILIIFLIIF